MDDLIKALQILSKYIDDDYTRKYPTSCTHDELHVNVNPEKVSREDIEELRKLGFEHNTWDFYSFRYGSC